MARTRLRTVIGNKVRIPVTIRYLNEETGELEYVDPSELKIFIESPVAPHDEVEYTYQGVDDDNWKRIEQGKYAFYILPDAVGTWEWRYEADGTYIGTDEDFFTITPSHVVSD